MRRMASWRRLAGRCLLAAGLAGPAGCLQFVNPVRPPAPEVAEPCNEMSPYARRHVYVFLANGVDPLCLGNLSGVRDYLHVLGFTRTYYGQPYHGHWFKKELTRACKEDQDARFVLIGYGAGADTLRAVARAVCPKGVCIDLFVSLQAKAEGCLSGGAAQSPATKQPVGAAKAGTTCVCPLPEEQMLGSPTDPRTLETLAGALVEVAGHVPLLAPPTLGQPETGPEAAPLPRPLNPGAETGPQPRPLNPGADNGPGPGLEWTALQPVIELHRYTPPEPRVTTTERPRDQDEADEDETDEPEVAKDRGR